MIGCLSEYVDGDGKTPTAKSPIPNYASVMLRIEKYVDHILSCQITKLNPFLAL